MSEVTPTTALLGSVVAEKQQEVLQLRNALREANGRIKELEGEKPEGELATSDGEQS